MYRVEITAETLSELAGKALALAAQFQTPAPVKTSSVIDAVMPELREEIVFEPTVGNAPSGVASSGTTEASPTATHSPTAEPAPEQEATKASSPAPVAEASVSELNFDTDVAPHVLALVKEKDKATAQEILSQFGVEKASLLDPARWPELVTALKDAM
jgi:hypothetical protein